MQQNRFVYKDAIMISNKSLGEHIRGLREKKNLTLRKLAAALI